MKLMSVVAAMGACAVWAEEPAIVHVRVFEQDGEVADGVRVTLQLPGRRAEEAWGMRVATVRRGLAVFSNVPAAQAYVIIAPDMPFVRETLAQRVKVTAGQRSTTVLVLPLHGTLRITASDGTASNMTIRCWHSHLRRVTDGAETGSQHLYTRGAMNTGVYAHVPVGTYTVDSQFNWMSVVRTTIVIRANKTTEVDGTPREPLYALTGWVRDVDDRAVRGRIDVRASGDKRSWSYGAFLGEYRIEPLQVAREYTVTFSIGTTSSQVRAAAGAPAEQNVRVPRSYRVMARLRHADGAVCSDGLYLGGRAAEYTNGVAVFEHVFPGTYELRYNVNNHVPVAWSVRVENSDVEISGPIATNAVVVRGRVLGEDVPEELAVSVRRRATDEFEHVCYVRLDEAGRFELGGVPREAAVRLYDERYRQRRVVLRAGPFTEDEYDAGDVHIKGGVTKGFIEKIVVTGAASVGVLMLLGFVLYALGVRAWAAREEPAGWRVWDGIMVLLFFILQSVVVGMIGVGLAGGISGGTQGVGGLMWALVAVNVLACAYVMLLAWARRGRLAELLPFRVVAWRRAAAWIILGALGTQGVSISVTLLLRVCDVRVPMQDALRYILGMNDVGEAVLTLLAAAVLVPVCEEIMFRGVIFGALWRRVTLWAAVVISAATFAMIHMELVYLLPVGVLGGVCAVSFARTRSLLVPVGIHVLNNLVAFGYVIWQLWTLG